LREVVLRRKRKSVFACLVLAAATLVPKAFPQNLRPLSVEHALSAVGFAELTAIEFSPDGRWLAYTSKDYRRATTVDLETWARSGVRDAFTGTDIWVVNVRTGEARCLTSGVGNNFMPVWSPNGRYLAFVSDRDGSRQAKLWLWDANLNKTKKVSELRIRQFGQIEWMPDSERILAPVVPDNMSLTEYVIHFTSGPANESVLVGKTVPRSTPIVYQANIGAHAHEADPISDPWSLDFWLRDLAVIDTLTGSATTVVHDKRIAHFAVSPDALHIAYTTPKRFEKPGSQQMLFDLQVLSLLDMTTQTLASDVRLDFDGTFNWSPDGSWLAFRRFGPEERTFDCYLVGLVAQQPRNITNLPPQTQWPRNTTASVLWDRNSRFVYFTTRGTLFRASVTETHATQVAEITERQIASLIPLSENSLWTTDGGTSAIVVTHDESRKQDGFYKINLESGESTQLLEAGQCYTCANLNQLFAVMRNGTHFAYFAEDAQHSADLWMTDSQFLTRKQLTNLDPEFATCREGAVRLVNWLSDDGEKLQGALLLPSNYEQGKRYPLVVWVYGGVSLSNDFDHFGLEGIGPFNMQLLATRGYAVLAPDSVERLGTPMLDLMKSVLPGINKLIEMGIADADRVAIMGHSHGGYNALALVVQTNRFKAAVMVDGIGDLVASYGAMDRSGAAFGISIAELGQGMIGGTPWQFRDRYIENSPIFYLDRVRTPVLIVQGAEDNIVPFHLSDEVFVGLRRLGKQVEYVKYSGEGHSPTYWAYANQVDFCDRVIAWLDKYLKSSSTQN
jgi:dipeptidyl aminopeptidase/acylaminoacyl peptidase